MNPKIGEMWEINDTVKVDVGNKRATFLVSGHGIVIDIHRNHDDHGDYYRVLWGGKTGEFFLSSFGERIG